MAPATFGNLQVWTFNYSRAWIGFSLPVLKVNGKFSLISLREPFVYSHRFLRQQMEQLISGLVLIQLPLELVHQQNGNALLGKVVFTGSSYLQLDLSLMGQQSGAVVWCSPYWFKKEMYARKHYYCERYDTKMAQALPTLNNCKL